MGDHILSLMTEKTDIVLLTRQRVSTQVEIKVGTDAIAASNAVKYLGLCLTRSRFGRHAAKLRR